jgi:signal transduction histidine kinase
MEWSTLVANQLHDLKNQLGVLMQRIDYGEFEDLPLLQRSSRLIHDDLRALLILFRLQQNEFALTRLDLPLCDVPQEAVARHEPLIDSSGIRVEIECDSAAIALYDRPLLVSVVAHGLLNAINAGATAITLQARPHDRGSLFSVDDNGSGLTGSAASSPETVVGTGLGLRLGEEIAQAHQRGGRRGWLSLGPSERLGGSRLELWIP